MITKFSWRRAVAVPAVLTLALGGALLSATAAQAADGQLVVTSPVGGPLDTRSVVVEGSAVVGSTITVLVGGGTETLAQQPVFADGTFSLTLPFYGTGTDDSQSIDVTGTTATGEAFDAPVSIDFTMPSYAPPTVAAPLEGTTTPTRDVTITGQASPGSVVTVADPDISEPAGQQTVPASGQYSIVVSYDETATEAQTVLVSSSAWDVPVERSFALPPVATVPTPVLDAPVITAPTQGETVTGTEVTFEGTGTPGVDIGLVVAPTDQVSTLADDPAARIVVDAAGDWTVTLALAPADYTAVAAQVLLDAAGQPVVDANGAPVASAPSAPVDFTLEAAAVAPLDAPVITSPTQGQVVVGDQVTFEGTGTPGSNILLAVVPTDQLDELEAAENGRAAAAAVPADPADPIIVDAAGDWTVTLALTPDDYTAAAVSFLLDGDGLPVLDAAGAPIVSAPSADVAFSLVAAVTPAALPTTGIGTGTGTTGLAYTGSEGTEAAIGIGAAVLLLGSTLMVLARRRAKLATTDVAGE